MSSPEHARSPNPDRARAQRGIEHDGHAQSPKLSVARPVWGIEQVAGRGEGEIQRLAVVQKGFVLRELFAAGIGRGAIAHRLQNGRLHVHYPGVYLVGRASIEPLGEEMAAVLYLRGHGILSHRTAAACGDSRTGCPARISC